MSIDPELNAFFYEQVFLVYDAYRLIKNDGVMGTQKDKQAAINASIALYHFRERLPKSVKTSVNSLLIRCPDYGLVRDVTNISKHASITMYVPKIIAVNEVLVTTRFKDDKGEYSNSEKVVEVELLDGSKRDLYEIMTNVVNMWFELLFELGISEERDPIVITQNLIVSRPDAKGMDLSITQGLQWKQTMQFRFFNYETGKIELVDFSSGQNIIFRVYEPPSIEVALNDESGEVVTKLFKPTPDEYQVINKITDKVEKDKLIMKLAKEHGLIDQMAKEFIEKKKGGRSH